MAGKALLLRALAPRCRLCQGHEGPWSVQHVDRLTKRHVKGWESPQCPDHLPKVLTLPGDSQPGYGGDWCSWACCVPGLA